MESHTYRQQRRLKYKRRTGSTELKVKPHGSTGTDDFTGDRHNMGGQAIQLNEHMTEHMTERNRVNTKSE